MPPKLPTGLEIALAVVKLRKHEGGFPDLSNISHQLLDDPGKTFGGMVSMILGMVYDCGPDEMAKILDIAKEHPQTGQASSLSLTLGILLGMEIGLARQIGDEPVKQVGDALVDMLKIFTKEETGPPSNPAKETKAKARGGWK